MKSTGIKYYLIVDEKNRVLLALVSVPFLPAFFMPYTVIAEESSDFPCHVGYQTLMDLKVVWKRE
jgi:hypothetical protein